MIDVELVTSIDASIEPIVVLEDIESGSLKTFLKTALHSTDDQALKELDWKPAVGKYLVKAKYIILRWIDNGDEKKDLQKLGQEIQRIAGDTDVRYIPAYAPVSSRALVRAIIDFEKVKDHLVSGDEASMIVSNDEIARFNLSTRLDIEDIEALATKEKQTHHIPSMVVVVKKPDYLGNSMWELRYGKRSISAKIEHAEWLEEFQKRRADVRPGDALKCRVRLEVLYGHDNELMSERYYIEHVHEVLANHAEQNIMFSPEQ